MNRLERLLRSIQATKAWRVWQRYNAVRGNVLAGGVAYFGLFSLFPALALGFTGLGLIVGAREDLQRKVVETVNDTFGTTLISTVSDEGVWTLDDLDNLTAGGVLTVTGLLGFVVALVSGLGWIGALRDGVSAVFGRRHGPNVVVAKATDLGMLALFGLSVLASVIGTILVTTATGPVLDWLGLGRSQTTGVAVSVLSSLVLLVIDTVLLLMLFRVMSGVRPALDDIFTGALAGGVGLGLIKLGGAVLLRLVSGNRLVATFGIVIGLLIWMNLAARLTLVAAAWAATTAADRGHLPLDDVRDEVRDEVRDDLGDGARDHVQPAALTPNYSARAADRTTLAAGAVLGLTVAIAARAVSHAGRSLRGPRD